MRNCPKCQGDKFKAVIKKGAVINIGDDGEPVVLGEGSTFKVIDSAIECASCGLKTTIEELMTKVPCSSCGSLHDEAELADGKCELCLLKEKLAGATQEDLFRLILELEHRTGAQGNKIERKLEEAEETVKNLEEKNEAEEEKKEEKKPKTRTRKKVEKKPEPAPVVETQEAESEAPADTKEEEAVPVVPAAEPMAEVAPAEPVPAVAPAVEAAVETAPAPVAPAPGTSAPVNSINDIFGGVPEEDLTASQQEEFAAAKSSGNPFDDAPSAEFIF